MIIAGIIIIVLASFIDGAVEGFEFDGRSFFEKHFGSDPFGFWGSMSWKRAETNPNLYNKLFGVFDFYHVCDDLRKYGYIAGAFIVGFWGGWLPLLIAVIGSVGSKKLGMFLIRRKPKV